MYYSMSMYLLTLHRYGTCVLFAGTGSDAACCARRGAERTVRGAEWMLGRAGWLDGWLR